MNEKLKQLLEPAKRIVVIQADNPDGDSLASALALEEIFAEQGKQSYLYCGVDIPDYLKHLQGWDRVSKEIPSSFDASVVVDTSAITLLGKLEASPARNWVASHPVIVLDHHAGVECDIPYASLVVNDQDAVATGEVIYRLAQELSWPLNLQAKTHIASSILADSLGLSSEGTTPATYRTMAALIEDGVNRPALEEARRALTKMPFSIFRYKAELIKRTEIHDDGRVALVTIPHEELMEYSPLYNPAPLIHGDILQIEGVKASIVLKSYKDGKITGSVRCNHGGHIAADLAHHFGGGGHPYASGFKLTNGKPLSEVKTESVRLASKLLNDLEPRA